MTDKTEAQPEALRLAEQLAYEATNADMGRKPIACTRRKAAAELRRQHAEIQQLKAAAQAIAELLPDMLIPDSKDWQDGDINQRVQFLLTMREANQQYCADLEAQLSARQAAPDGWRLVPESPTEEMVTAGQESFGVHDCYYAMLSAAPPAPGRPQCSRTGISEQACPAHPRNLPDREQ